MCDTTFEVEQRALDGGDPEGQTTLSGGIVPDDDDQEVA